MIFISLPPYIKPEIRNLVSFYPKDEIWLPVNCNVVKQEIRPIYFVSSFGRVFSKSHSLFLTKELSNVGYYRVHLIKGDGKSAVHVSVHRLVLGTFNPIPNMDDMVVNHINGIKTDNRLCNLEWTTVSGNTQHAIYNNFIKWQTEDECSWSSIDSQTADIIAQLILTNQLTYNDIARECKCTKSVVTNIANGISWRSVYKKYKLWKIRNPANKIVNSFNYKLIYQYIAENIDKYIATGNIRALCMDISKEIFKRDLNRSLNIEIMDVVFQYLEDNNLYDSLYNIL